MQTVGGGLGGANRSARRLRDFVDAYNFARRLKTLRGLTE
jgi:hypothetical protein